MRGWSRRRAPLCLETNIVNITMSAICLALALVMLVIAEKKRRKRQPFTFPEVAIPIGLLALGDAVDLYGAIARAWL